MEIINLKIKEEDENKYRELMELLPQVVFETDMRGNLTCVNKYAFELFGYSPDELKAGINIFNIIIPEDKERARGNFIRVLNGERQESDEYKVLKKNGDKFHALIYSSPIIRQNKPTGLRGVLLDITDRKQAEEKIKELNAKLKSIFNSTSSLAFIITDESGTITFFSEGAKKMLGYSAEEIIGKQTPLIFHLESEMKSQGEALSKMIGYKPDGFHIFEELVKQNGDYEEEWTYVRKDGTNLIVKLSINYIYNEKGEISGCLHVARDITEQKLSEKALINSEKRFKAIFDNLSNGILIIDMESNNILDANVSQCNMLGYTLEELRNLPVMNIHPEEDRLKIIKIFEEKLDNLKAGINSCTKNLPVLRKDKSVFYCDINSTLITLDGKLCNVAIFRDMTERMEMEQKLMQKNRELNDFAHRVSHDLKNPINLIRGYANVIKEKPELFNTYFEKIINKTDSLLNFIDNLLKLSKAGMIIDKKKKIDLEKLIKKIYISLKKNNVASEISIKSPIPEIIGDTESMEHMFFNLIENSFKYRSLNNDKLLIEVEHSHFNGSLQILYKDNGSGIENIHLDKIFNPGYVISKEKGTGFGLSIVKKIVEAHDGDITVRSDGKDKGTEFIIKFPMNVS